MDPHAVVARMTAAATPPFIQSALFVQRPGSDGALFKLVVPLWRVLFAFVEPTGESRSGRGAKRRRASYILKECGATPSGRTTAAWGRGGSCIKDNTSIVDS